MTVTLKKNLHVQILQGHLQDKYPFTYSKDWIAFQVPYEAMKIKLELSSFHYSIHQIKGDL